MRKVVAALVAIGVAIPAGFARTSKPKTDEARQFRSKLSKDQRVLHALDRLTFGPRPGDVARVRRLGLKKWLDQQLHPERIAENPDLETRLAPLEALRMTQIETLQHYPTQQMIRAVANGRQPLPQEPVLRAAVERMVQRYKIRKSAAEKDDVMEPVQPLEAVLSAEQLRIVRSGTPEKKKELLASLPQQDLDAALVAMPAGMRQQLFNAGNEELRRKVLLLSAPQSVVNYDLSEGKLYRAIYSNRQLEELLTDFWYNHFNVYLDKGADRFLVPTYERDAIRPHVLGHFRDLLEATAKSPAMLFYLDNWQSVAPQPPNAKARRATRGLNENYARELMELHTLGVDGGYTQKDIIEVARCFTGWTIQNPNAGGQFTYNDKVHDKGEKVVLGVTIPAGGGQQDAEKVLDILVHHPSTARFIARKLAMRFVADNPPQALLDRMAETFTKTDGDLRQVMKAMLDSKEFWTAGAYHAKVKTPFEMTVSAVRALDATVDYAFPLAQQIANLGQPLYRKQEPTGYSSANAEWVNSAALLARMNFALALAQNRIAGVRIDAARLGTDPVEVAKALLFRDMSNSTRLALDKALQDRKTKTAGVVAGLVLGSPEFQRR